MFSNCLFVQISLYLWSKGSLFVLFVFIKIHRTWNASDCVLSVFGKLSTRRDAWAWFHDIWTCSAKVLEYWMISSLKIKLNCSLKFLRNQNMALMLLKRSWWARFNGIYLVRLGFRMWEMLISNWFLPLKIQISSK
jgi:hypothetical protein